MNLKSAFKNRDLDERVYMMQQEEFHSPQKKHLMQVD